MNILTAAEMAEADRRSVSDFGVPMASLMENAGCAVARFIKRQYPGVKRILVLCGKGNNGGDGLVAARVLAQAGKDVTVGLLAAEAEFKGQPAAVLAELKAAVPELRISTITDIRSEALGAADLIVDAVVGTGFKPPLRGVAAELRDWLAGIAVPVVAVDLPSGWDADSMEQSAASLEQAFRADSVVTFTAPKRAHIFGHLTPGKTFGPVVVAAIGSPREAIFSSGNLHWAGSAKALTESPREINSNKGKFGHVLVIGGSYGTAGAPSMSSLAALRAGAGLVTAAVPESILNLVALVAPELMLAPLSQGSEGAVDLRNLEPQRWAALRKKISVIAVGPGLSTKGEASKFARRLVAGFEGETNVPIVIDADALNAFKGRSELLNGDGRVMVLTPHPGEMASLTGMTIREVEADRIGLARRFATEHKVTLVLKGWRTLVAHPDGSVGVNTTGNPAMAKGGSGDILTGIVAAMLAQFPNDVPRAVEAAVYLHGSAADFAAHAMDEHTVLATDTVAHLSDAFRYRTRDADGFEWIAGVHAW